MYSHCIHFFFDFYGLLYFFLLFFKQKTAYEMRISDWSSDVCSSDLLPSEDAVELDGVAHRLVDLQRHLLAAEDEGGDGLGALRRAQQRLRLLDRKSVV